MKKLFVLLALSLSSIVSAQALQMTAKPLDTLMAGNERYVSGKPQNPNQEQERREALVGRQDPFAIIVSCSDSRIPPELVFDQGLGDIFVVRVAGNIIGPIEMDSVEFAVDTLGTQFILVLGHQNCGAVNAMVSEDAKAMQDIKHIAPYIAPAIKRSAQMPGNRLTNAIKTNALMVAENLRKSDVLKKHIKNGTLQIESGYFNLETGRVEILK